MSFWRKISPTRAAKDFATEFRRPQPYRWYIVGIAAASTFAVFSVMWQEGGRGLPPAPVVTYITSWRADRSDAEIIKGNIENQRRNDEFAAQQKAREEDVRAMYRALGRVSGMDVDKIEREAKAEQAKEDRAKTEEQKRLMGKAPPERPDAATQSAKEKPSTEKPSSQGGTVAPE